ncbi:hypothetical protein C8J57DRAFT_1246785 [Mycena rebaudengoi]|nr:hypothetical protein C8J57DRAFT_1246785 [Mycena rebaudengoi]
MRKTWRMVLLGQIQLHWIYLKLKNPQDHEADNSFTFDDPAYKDTLSDIPNKHSPKVLALYLVYKIFYQVKKIGTANTARANGITYRDKWHYHEAKSRWEGNPVDTAETKFLELKAYASTALTVWSSGIFELVKLQEKHLTFGLEDPQAFNTPYFELYLTIKNQCSNSTLGYYHQYN